MLLSIERSREDRASTVGECVLLKLAEVRSGGADSGSSVPHPLSHRVCRTRPVGHETALCPGRHKSEGGCHLSRWRPSFFAKRAVQLQHVRPKLKRPAFVRRRRSRTVLVLDTSCCPMKMARGNSAEGNLSPSLLQQSDSTDRTSAVRKVTSSVCGHLVASR